MLEVKNLSKIYAAKGGASVKALDGVSLRFPETGMVFLLGKSGSGKSTLLNVCGGLDSPTDGEIIVKGRSSKTFSQSDFDSYRNTHIGFIFQEYNVLDEFTVGDNLALALELQGKAKDNAKIAELLKQVDLEGYEDRKPNTLSGGQKQRIAIARALIKSPEIIMADEPTGALDSETGKQIFDTLKKLSKEKLVLVVSHDREFAETYADRIVELKDGKVVSDVSKGEEDFFATEEEKIPTREYGEEERKFVRSKLPVRHAVKMGVSGLKAKPLRLAFTLLLCTVTFIIFGLFSTLTFYNPSSALYESLRASDLSTVQIAKNYRKYRKAYSYGVLQEEDTTVNGTGRFTEAEREAYAALYGEEVFGGFVDWNPDIFTTQRESGYWFNYFQGYAYLPENHPLRARITLGRYPEAEGEACITSYVAESMIQRKLQLSNGAYLEASSASELLGNQFSMENEYCKIVGIIDSDPIPSKFESLKSITDKSYQGTDLYGDLQDFLEDGWHLIRFLSKNDYENRMDLSKTYSIPNEFICCYPTSKDENGEYQFTHYFSNGKFSSPSYLGKEPDVTYFEEGKTELEDTEVVVSASYLYSRFNHLENLCNQLVNEYINACNGSYQSERESIAIRLGNLLQIDWSTKEALGIVVGWEDVYIKGGEGELPQEGDEKYSLYLEWRDSETVQSLKELYSKRTFYMEFKELIGRLNRNGRMETVDGNTFIVPYTKEERAAEAEKFLECLKREEYADVVKMYLCDPETEGTYGKCMTYTVVGTYGLYDYDVSHMGTFAFSEAECARLGKMQRDRMPDYEETTSDYVMGKDEIYTVLFLPYDRLEEATNRIVGVWNSETEFDERGSVIVLKSAWLDGFELVDDMIAQFSTIFLWVGLVFVVFTALLLFNFISVSITQKGKDIGILRALGARGADVFKIFFSESFFLTLICVILSIGGSLIVCQVVNGYMMSIVGASIFVFGLPSVLVLVGVALLTVCIGTFVPVYLEARKKPVDSIRKL